MAYRIDESLEAEEITALRFELVRVKGRLQERQKLAQRTQECQQQLAALIDILGDRTVAVQQLATTLGIKTSLGKELSQVKALKRGKDMQKNSFGRVERIRLELDVQEELLRRINELVFQLIKDNEENKSKVEKLSKQHSHCQQIEHLLKEKLEKIKHMEKQLEQKDTAVVELNKNNQSLQEEISLFKKKNEQNSQQLQELSKEVQAKNREVEEGRDIIQSAQQATKEKQRILEGCEKLIGMITIPQEEYLKYYFRSNGLPLEPPRQQRNKYSIVFDS